MSGACQMPEAGRVAETSAMRERLRDRIQNNDTAKINVATAERKYLYRGTHFMA